MLYLWALFDIWSKTKNCISSSLYLRVVKATCLNLPQACVQKVWKSLPHSTNFHSFFFLGLRCDIFPHLIQISSVQNHGGGIFTAFTFIFHTLWLFKMIKKKFIMKLVKMKYQNKINVTQKYQNKINVTQKYPKVKTSHY